MTSIEVSTEDHYKLNEQVRSAANWFYWIAGLSLLNLVAGILGYSWTFVVGLSLTQVLQGVATGLSAEWPEATLIINSVVYLFIAGTVGLFALFGYLSRKGQQWAFVVGAAMYAVDTLIFLMSGQLFGMIFHLLALLVLFNGVRSLRRARAIESGTIQVVERVAPRPKVRRDRRYWFKLLLPALVLLLPFAFFLILFFVL